jgi:hypothetical protein
MRRKNDAKTLIPEEIQVEQWADILANKRVRNKKPSDLRDTNQA